MAKKKNVEADSGLSDSVRPASPDDGEGAQSLDDGVNADGPVTFAAPYEVSALLDTPAAAGDFVQWFSPLCVARVVESNDWGYMIEALPGINGTPLDVKAGEIYSVSLSCVGPLPDGVVIPEELRPPAGEGA